VKDLVQQKQVLSIKAHKGFVLDCSFSRDAAFLVSCSDDEQDFPMIPTMGENNAPAMISA
jgi:hypothetical protein